MVKIIKIVILAKNDQVWSFSGLQVPVLAGPGHFVHFGKNGQN